MPTYNRKEKALAQIRNVINQCHNIIDKIEFLVSDNNSSDATYLYILNSLKNLPSYIHIYKQSENLGLVGNLYFLFQEAQGDYVWFISDDDRVNEGTIEAVINRIKSSLKDFYLLNFNLEVDGKIEGLYWQPSEKYESRYVDGQTGGFGLLSVQVLKKEKFIDLYALKEKEYNLMQPVAVSMYGLFYLEGMMLFDKAYVTHHVGDYSWIGRYTEVQSVCLYKALISLQYYVSASVLDKMLSMVFSTRIFKRESFKYVCKTKDRWYIHELRRRKIFWKIVGEGILLYYNKIINKCLTINRIML